MKAILVALAFLAFAQLTAAQNATCTACEYVTEFAEYGIKYEGYNAAQLEALLVKACGFYPSLTDACEAVVALYIDPIVNELTNGASPQQVCTSLSLCTSDDKKQNTPDFNEEREHKKHGRHGKKGKHHKKPQKEDQGDKHHEN